jgi:hypothetical protein
MGIFGVIGSGVKSVRTTVKKQKAAYERRGVRRGKAMMRKLESQKLRADTELVKLARQREIYETHLEVKKQKEIVKRTRQAAGKFTPRERAVKVLRGTGVISGAFYRGFVDDTPTRSTRRRG